MTIFRLSSYARRIEERYNRTKLNFPERIVALQTIINDKLLSQFELQHLAVSNESSGHNVPAGSETHFSVVLVSEDFAGMRRLARHRAVHEVLADELKGGVHALAVHTYTEAEWRDRFGSAPLSPPCLGGKAGEESAEEAGDEDGA